MRNEPALSVLIPWFNREEIRWTLAANLPAFIQSGAEVLVINCGGDPGRLRDLIRASEVRGVRQVDLAAPRFNKCATLNVGLSRAAADTVFILDADVVLLDDTLQEGQAVVQGEAFVTVEWVFETESRKHRPDLVGNVTATLVNTATVEFAFRNGTRFSHQINRQNLFDRMRAGPGLLMARKQDLLDIHGYNAEFHSWGWEDDDVLVRLQYMLGRQRVQLGRALHLSHGDDARAAAGSRTKSGQYNFVKACRKYNQGSFLGTYQEDVNTLADSIKESVVNAVPEQPRKAISKNLTESRPPTSFAPDHCSGAGSNPEEDAPAPAPKLGELLLEATLFKLSTKATKVLYVGVRDTRLASRVAPWCGQITGVVNQRVDLALAALPETGNFSTLACDTYREGFGRNLPYPRYDIIVDGKIGRYSCCQRHWVAAMENYARVLAVGGCLLTLEPGVDTSPGPGALAGWGRRT